MSMKKLIALMTVILISSLALNVYLLLSKDRFQVIPTIQAGEESFLKVDKSTGRTWYWNWNIPCWIGIPSSNFQWNDAENQLRVLMQMSKEQREKEEKNKTTRR